MTSAQKIGRYTPGLNRGHLSPSPDHNTGSTSVRESVKIRASQSDAAYEETVEKHGRRQKGSSSDKLAMKWHRKLEMWFVGPSVAHVLICCSKPVLPKSPLGRGLGPRDKWDFAPR